jgi:protein TonB
MQFARGMRIVPGTINPGGTMLRNLLESQAAPTRRFGGTAISVALHTAAIALAVVATARATSSPRLRADPITKVIYDAPPRAPRHEHQTSTPHQSTTTSIVPVVRPVLIAPIIVPKDLPPIDVTRPPTDERVYDGAFTRVGGGPPGLDGSGLNSPNDPYPVGLVEKAAVPRPGNPAPIYPAALRSAQIEGSVIARFVVDTSGRAEPASITFADVSHAQFADAVRQSLLRSRYLPAMIGGRAVRQLVEQRFAFTLTR